MFYNKDIFLVDMKTSWNGYLGIDQWILVKDLSNTLANRGGLGYFPEEDWDCLVLRAKREEILYPP